MRIVFIVMALVLSVGARADELTAEANSAQDNVARYVAERQAAREARERKRHAIKPPCLNVRFTGVAVPILSSFDNSPHVFSRMIERVLASPDIEDTIARNPIQCRHGGGVYSCRGYAFFENHKGKIADWDEDTYWVDTAVDFNTGRKNMTLAILKKDAVCAK